MSHIILYIEAAISVFQIDLYGLLNGYPKILGDNQLRRVLNH